MREISLEELKKLQMDVLEAIDIFCRDNDIRYSIACGTLLGAVRHKGYIPWDDDIDIYMLRSEYDKLISKFPLLYKEKYKLLSLERSNKWDLVYAKAFNDETIVIEAATVGETYGVNIDIYPIDNVPDDDKEWKRYNKWRRKIQLLHAYQFRTYDSMNSWIKKFLLFLVQPFSRLTARFIDSFVCRYNNEATKYVFESSQGLLVKNRFERNLFDHLIEMKFEDRTFMAFADFDNYLSNAYGDYMKLPPKEKRVTHHTFKAFWKV